MISSSHMTRLCDETRPQAMEHIKKYEQDIKMKYDERVKQRTFCLEDWVLKRVVCTLKHEKLDSNKKGPYIIIDLASKVSYFMHTMEDKLLELP